VKSLTVQRLASFVVALGLVISMPPSYAQLFNGPVDQLSPVERAELRSGKVLVTGEKGSYVGRILVTASVGQVWDVLTDYPGFSKFLPHVTSSRVVRLDGDQKIIEQIDERRVLVLNVRSRVLSAVTETNQQRITFRRIEGDVPKLEGYWSVEPVAPYAGAPPDQVLITQVVAVEPVENVPTGMFYNFFKSSLRDNFVAIHKEINRREQKK
jgi:ribosome-associated toxin RatA of RatAB toxin-antitoxin module